jgi:hypothetical protein
MTLKELSAEGRLRRRKTSPREIADLLRVVDRDMADACIQRLSADRRFATAYNAALQLATIVLHAAGYQATGAGHHWVTLHVLPEIMGPRATTRADYFDGCRTKRNITDYDRAGEISAAEVSEILQEVRAFRANVLAWLSARRPSLLPKQ